MTRITTANNISGSHALAARTLHSHYKNASMKIYSLIIALSVGFNLMIYGQNHCDSLPTKIIKVNNLNDLDALTFNFCDSFSIEVNGLYPILDSLPSLINDSTLIKVLLIKKGFAQVDWGSGNWEKGPRFIYLKFKKGDCTCNTFKKYYYNKKINDGLFDLRVSERIICNSDKFMDD